MRKKRIKRRIIALFSLLLLTVAVFAFVNFKTNEFEMVLGAISFADAKSMAESQQNTHIVQVNYSTGCDYQVLIDEDSWVGVRLTGENTPGEYLGNAILANENKFMIFGKLQEIEEKDDVDIMGENQYSLEVENWAILAPIKRDYTYSKHGKSRFFYPKSYLDKFDLDSGDYSPEGR